MSHSRHPIKTMAALALALGAITPQAASAQLLSQPGPPTTPPPVRTVEVVRVAAPGGFDWGDAGIGAVGGLGLATLAVGGGLVIAQRRGRRSGASPATTTS
jgi:hypothetical protein